MNRWRVSHNNFGGYDGYGVYHDDPHGIFYVLLRRVIRLARLAFWHSPALFTAYALLAWVRHAAGGLEGLPGWAFPVTVLLIAGAIAWLMAAVSKRARTMRTNGNLAWVPLMGVVVLYGFVLPALVWRTLFVVGLGWWQAGGPHAWISWLVGGTIGLLIFWRSQSRI
jgi:hypothetical protein